MVEKAIVSFDHKHYVPILRGKAGEFRALKALTPRVQTGLTPLIEVPGIPWNYSDDIPAATVDAHVKGMATKIHDGRRHFGRVFIDLALMVDDGKMADGTHPLTYIFGDAKQVGLEAVPVTGLGRNGGPR